MAQMINGKIDMTKTTAGKAVLAKRAQKQAEEKPQMSKVDAMKQKLMVKSSPIKKALTNNPVYEPSDDSFMLLNHIKHLKGEAAMDMGTGTGLIADKLSEHFKKVYAVDINEKAIEYCKKKMMGRNITFVQSDLFNYFKTQKMSFDLIVFNAPYLPDDSQVKDLALDGGKQGCEIAIRFLNEAKNYIKNNGKVMLLFSSLSHPKKILESSEKDYNHYLIEKKQLDFEELFIYQFEKKVTLSESKRK